MKKIVTLFAILCLTSICGCSTKTEKDEITAPKETTVETTVPFDGEEYKNQVSSCVEKINDSAIALHNMVITECKYIDLLGRPDADGAYDTAIIFIEENSDYTEESVKSQHEEISESYKDIISAQVPGELDEIKETFGSLADAYIGLYNLAMSPSGNVATMASNHDEYVETITTCTSKLEILLS